MVEAAARVVGVLDVAAQDRLHRPQRPGGHDRGRLVHARERRLVRQADAHRARQRRIRREPPDLGEVAPGRWTRSSSSSGRGLGREARLGPDGPQEVDPGPEPLRRQRVVRPEVVVERARPEDEERPVGAAGWLPFRHDTAMERVYTTPRLDKLGIRPGMRVALVDLDDAAGRARERTHDITEGDPLPGPR